MPQGISRVLHSGWFYAVDKASRLTNRASGSLLDATLALRNEAQRSRRIATGMDAPGARRRALARLLWRRKFAVLCVAFAFVAADLITRGRLEWAGTSVVAALIFLGLEIDDLTGRGA